MTAERKREKNCLPIKNVSVLGVEIVHAAIPPYDSRACEILPSSVTRRAKHDVTIAISSSLRFACMDLQLRIPRKRSAQLTCLYALTTSLSLDSFNGTIILSITAPFGNLVLLYPVKKSSIASSIVPSILLATTFAPTAIHTGFRSDIGDAVAMFPPTEATLRICQPAK